MKGLCALSIAIAASFASGDEGGNGKNANIARKFRRNVCRFSFAHDFALEDALPLKEKIGISFNPHLNLTGPRSSATEDFDADKHIVGTKLGHSYPNLKPDKDYCLVCYAITHQTQNITLRVGCHNGPVPQVRLNGGYPAFTSAPNEYDIGGWESFRQMQGRRIHIFQSLFKSSRQVGDQTLTGHTYDIDACLEGDDEGYCMKRDEGKGCQLYSYFVAANSPGLLSHQCWMLPLLEEELRGDSDGLN